MASMSLIERDSIVLLEILLRIVSLHVELEIKCIQISRKETFHKQPVVLLLK